MAGKAGDFALAFKIVFVDGEHHLDHLARDDFGFLSSLSKAIPVVILADVAVLALHAERCGDELHGREHLLGGDALQDFDVLELFFGEFGRGRRLGGVD